MLYQENERLEEAAGGSQLPDSTSTIVEHGDEDAVAEILDREAEELRKQHGGDSDDRMED